MPIRPAFRPLYPPHWPALSRRVRFEHAGGRCKGCGRPHLAQIRCLPDGRWFDATARTWRDRRGRPARWPDLIDAVNVRITRVVLAAAHLDGNPANNRIRNLRGLCQRCHLLHDRPYHLQQRWLTYRRRRAIGDLFFGVYDLQPPSAAVFATAWQTGVAAGRTRIGADAARTTSRADAGWLPPRAIAGTTRLGSADDLFARVR